MTDVSRREWLKQAGLAGAVAATLPELSHVLLVRRSLGDGRVLAQAAPRVLSVAEFATLDALCARLIPTDDNGPGAREARAAYYIDDALGGALASSREGYVVGLAATDAYARLKRPGAASFSALSEALQDEVIVDIERGVASGFGSDPGSATVFFNLVRGHTLQGMFCDPAYGGNAGFVGWDLLGYPGVRLTVAAADQDMARPPARNHKGAYDYPMFSQMGPDVRAR
jgi:gluconate 2-dehydrogenase gamma chain